MWTTGTNRTDHEIRTHHNAQSGESRTLCSKHNIYIFKKSSQNYNQTARGRRVTDAFLLSSLRLKIFMNHNIGRKSEVGGDLVLLQTFLLFKYLLIVVFSCQQAREHDHLHMKDENVCNKVTAILTSIQRPGHWARNCKMTYSRTSAMHRAKWQKVLNMSLYSSIVRTVVNVMRYIQSNLFNKDTKGTEPSLHFTELSAV